MSNILKGILNETSPHDYDSDWDYQDAVARSGKSRSSYRSQEDDTFDADVAYSRKMYQLGQQQKAAKEKAQRDSDHDRLASGTNEGAPITTTTGSIEPGGAVDNFKQQMANKTEIDYKKKQQGVAENEAQRLSVQQLATISDEALDNAYHYGRSTPGNTFGWQANLKSASYAKQMIDKGVTDIEAISDAIHKGWNITAQAFVQNPEQFDDTAKLQAAGKLEAKLQQRAQLMKQNYAQLPEEEKEKDRVVARALLQAIKGNEIKEDDKTQTRMRMNDYYELADAIQEKLRHAIRMGDKERIQQLSKERDELDARITKHGLLPESQLDELSNQKLSQYKTAAALDAGKADSEGDYKRGNKRFSGIVKATKKQFANDTKKSAIGQGISEEFRPTTSQAMNIRKQTTKKLNPGASKLVWKRPNQISGSHSENELKSLNFKYSTKYNMWGGTQDMWNRLSGSLDENVGDQLKSTALDALIQAKLAIEKHHEAEGEAYKQDLIKNNASRLPKQNIKTFQPIPVLKPGENPDVLRDRLKHLDIAKQRFMELNELIDAIKDKYPLVADKLDQLDNSLLQDVKDGPADNYKSLLIKLTQYKSDLGEKYPTAVAYLAKKKGVTENHDERDEYDNPRQGRDYGKGNLFVDPGSNEFEKNVPAGVPGGPRGKPKNLKGISKKLPADAFGRTTGKIPAGKPGKVHSMMNKPDEVDEDMSRRGFLKGMGAAAVAGAAGSAMGQSQRPMAGLPNVDKVDKQKMTITLDGQEYPLVILSPTDLRPRGGQQVHITCAELGERCLGRYDAILAFNRVFVLPGTKPIERPKEVDEEKQRLDPKCWDGYKKQGTKMKGDTRVNNCVPVKETKSHILAGLQQVDEGWKEKLGAAALAGSMALGAGSAQGRVTYDADGNQVGGMKPTATVQAEPAPATPSTTTIPGQGLVRAERADRQAGTVTVDGQEYKMIMLEPGGIRPRGGQQIVIPQAVMGERGMGNYMAILAGGRVFVLPRND